MVICMATVVVASSNDVKHLNQMLPSPYHRLSCQQVPQAFNWMLPLQQPYVDCVDSQPHSNCNSVTVASSLIANGVTC